MECARSFIVVAEESELIFMSSKSASNHSIDICIDICELGENNNKVNVNCV